MKVATRMFVSTVFGMNTIGNPEVKVNGASSTVSVVLVVAVFPGPVLTDNATRYEPSSAYV